MRSVGLSAPAVALIVLMATVEPLAQSSAPQTRADALRRARATKAGNLTPNEPDRIQRAMTEVEERAVLFGVREGWQPTVGTVGRGGGLAIGALYRDRDMFKRYGIFEFVSLYSMRRYWLLEARSFFPDLANGRIVAQAAASLRDHRRDDFYGVGPDSLRSDRSRFGVRTFDVGGSAGVRPAAPLLVGGGLRYLQPRVRSGPDGGTPSIDERFTLAETPGFDVRSNYVATSTFVELDYRYPKHARQGGFARLDFTRFDDVNAGMDFTRTDLDVRQFVGFLAGRRVLAFRGLLSTTNADSGGQVPFYLMPWLGSSRTLRGFSAYRFRGPHALLLQAEYRWEIWSGFDGALFYDAGKVAMSRDHINLKHLASDYGIGFRFNTNNGIILRFDAALGGTEGRKFRISFGPFL